MIYHKLFFIILIFLFQSCTFYKFEPVLHGEKENKPEVIPIDSNEKIISIQCDTTCSAEEKKQLVNLVKETNRVFYGNCFKTYFKNKKKFDFVDNDSGEKIIEKLHNGPINTVLTYFYKKRNIFTGSIVVGFENGDGKIHANRAAWAFLNEEEKVSNIIHELTHQKGFKHDGNSYAGNENSVPYQANTAVETCF